jgi:hypothetical protein
VCKANFGHREAKIKEPSAARVRLYRLYSRVCCGTREFQTHIRIVTATANSRETHFPSQGSNLRYAPLC